MQGRDLDRLIGSTLRRARDELGWTQADLVAELHAAGWGGWVPSTVAGIESGSRRVSLTEAGELADVLGVGIGYLLDAGDDDERRESAARIARAFASANSHPAPPYAEARAEATREARADLERGDLERLLIDRLECTRDDLAVTVRNVFEGSHGDVLGVREDLAQYLVDAAREPGRPIELSTARRHATRGILKSLGEYLAAHRIDHLKRYGLTGLDAATTDEAQTENA